MVRRLSMACGSVLEVRELSLKLVPDMNLGQELLSLVLFLNGGSAS